MAQDTASQIATALKLPSKGVAEVITLLEAGNTVPFIARYRKEVTGGLDEVAIRDIQEKLATSKELEDRRKTILAKIAEQGKLTAPLRASIEAATTKSELEDLYLPYKKKRRTRAAMAKEKGLQPLADLLSEQSSTPPAQAAQKFIDAKKGVASAEEALAGARDIVAELLAEQADLRAHVRETFSKKGKLCSRAVKSKTKEPTKFEQYYDFSEAVHSIPSHRFLALLRGESEGLLRVSISIDEERILSELRRGMGYRPASPWSEQLALAVEDGYRRLLAPSVTNEVRSTVKVRADTSAAAVFADNLRNLLLAAPLGTSRVIGVDPGLRTGCKCAAVGETGSYEDTCTIYLTRGEAAKEKAASEFLRFVQTHRPSAIAVGNGTGGRETEAFIRKSLKSAGRSEILVISVNEAGASVYSASDIAREEFPQLDLTIRGAISIARRLQDPLAELVKVDPKAIGVGQYQHDLQPALLQRKLEEVVESCVNHVGVLLNTSSAPLLACVAGIGAKLARQIVDHRDSKGPFQSRKELLKVKGLGPRAYEQCAGFLRIRGSAHPLDSSAIHPERYALVEAMAKDIQLPLSALVGNSNATATIDLMKYAGPGIGQPTLRDIRTELEKPGRDPRSEFSAPQFRDDVNSMSDLREGMKLEGVVTNVTAFGAFVDVGVHQDGLVHVSKLSNRYISDPKEVVRVGQRLSVTVMQVDLQRKRISLSALKEESSAPSVPKKSPTTSKPAPKRPQAKGQKAVPNPAFANNPFAKLKR